MNKVIPTLLLGFLSLLLISCELPVCENGSTVCIYKIVNSPECLEKCAPDSSTVCPSGKKSEGYSCICGENDDNCVVYTAHSDTDIFCYPHKCENNDLAPIPGETCDSGFDGARAMCKPECMEGEVKYDEEPGTDPVIQKCVLVNGKTRWENTPCKYGIDKSSQECKPKCTLNAIEYDEGEDHLPIIKTCVADPEEEGQTKWNEMTCKFGIDKSKQECAPRCVLDEIRYEETGDTHIIKTCVADPEGEGQTKWDELVCKYGIDKSNQVCKPKCSLNTIEYDEPDNQDPIIRSCVEDPQNPGENRWQETTCPNGIDKSKAMCNPKCRPGDIKFINSIIMKCLEDQSGSTDWQETPCKFGINEAEVQCADPCFLEACSADGVSCSKVLYDGERIYRCDTETGWYTDNLCTMDFHVEDSMPQDISLDAISLSAELKTEKPDGLTELSMGNCGECSTDSSPSFCSKISTTSYLHTCENGEFKSQADSCTQFKDACADEYGTIYVNLKSNRNHCGACNHKCGESQTCENGTCMSHIECGEDNYVHLQIGTRWINAYCIKTVDDLKLIGKQTDNLDNAYILYQNIEIGETWTPIELANGFFLGNQKSITFNSGSKLGAVNNPSYSSTTYSGVFWKISNSYVEDLSIIYDSEQPIDASYFGLLAGQVTSSNIQGVSVSAGNIQLSNSKFVASGGMIGLAEKSTVANAKLNMAISGVSSTTSEQSGIGGLIGVAKDYGKIQNISQLDPNSTITVTGGTHVGGLIGMVYYPSNGSSESDSVFALLIDNSGGSNLRTKVTGEKYVGGFVGRIMDKSTGNISPAAIRNIKIAQTSLTLKQTNGTASINLSNVEAGTSTTVISRFFGGFVGSAEGKAASPIPFNSITLSKVTIAEELPASLTKASFSANVGGIAGVLNQAKLDQITVTEMSFKDNSTWIYRIGGIAGKADGVTLSNYTLNQFRYVATPMSALTSHISFTSTPTELSRGTGFYIGGVMGYVTSSTLSKGTVGGSKAGLEISISGASSYLGGLMGYALDTEVSQTLTQTLNVYKIKILNTSNWLKDSYTTVGGLIGYAQNAKLSYITAKTIELTGTGKSKTGGLIGESSSTTIQSDTLSDLSITWTNGEKVGGMVGQFAGGTVSASKLNGTNRIESDSVVGGVIASASGSVNISNIRTERVFVYGPISYGGLIHTLSSMSFTITTSVVESYVDYSNNGGGNELSGSGFIHQFTGGLSGSITYSFALATVNKQNYDLTFNNFIPEGNFLIETEGNTHFLWAFRYNGLNVDIPIGPDAGSNDTVNNFKCCFMQGCCLNNGLDDPECVGQTSYGWPYSQNVVYLSCDITSRVLLTNTKDCSTLTYMQAVTDAFGSNIANLFPFPISLNVTHPVVTDFIDLGLIRDYDDPIIWNAPIAGIDDTIIPEIEIIPEIPDIIDPIIGVSDVTCSGGSIHFASTPICEKRVTGKTESTVLCDVSEVSCQSGTPTCDSLRVQPHCYEEILPSFCNSLIL